VNHPRAGNGGLLSTAGKLVFQGSVDGMFNAYAADTGARLWSHDVQNAVLGGPVTFELDGEQYVSALAGIGGVAVAGVSGTSLPRSAHGRVVTFKIGGQAALPALLPNVVRKGPDVRRANAEGNVASGQQIYDNVCSVCHGISARSEKAIPDLLYSSAIVDRDTFKAIVIDGARANKGMAGFASVLTPVQAEEIRAYLVSLAVAL
jgi:mono/diheme cytochrome c family protein